MPTITLKRRRDGGARDARNDVQTDVPRWCRSDHVGHRRIGVYSPGPELTDLGTSCRRPGSRASGTGLLRAST